MCRPANLKLQVIRRIGNTSHRLILHFCAGICVKVLVLISFFYIISYCENSNNRPVGIKQLLVFLLRDC